jgi:hypothetical protein
MAFQAWFMAWLDLADEGYDLVDESMGILEKFGNSEPLLFACYSLGVNA